MALSNEVLVAIIGVLSALSVVLIKDIFFQSWTSQYNRRRSLLQRRLEYAYVPLEYLSFMLLRSSDQHQRERLLEEIGGILRQHGHLLSEETLSAFYILIDNVDVGASHIQSTFIKECAELKQAYFKLSNTLRIGLQAQGE